VFSFGAGSILRGSQSGDNPYEDLASFFHNLNITVEIVKHLSLFMAILLEPYIEIWLFWLKFWIIMATEKSQKAVWF